jgi:DNA-binding MarR family transcriptional regulator
MNNISLIEALRQAKPKLSTWTVLLNLADHADADGVTWITQKRQAEEIGTTREAVRDAIRFAEERNWLTKTIRSRQGSRVIYTYTFASVLVAEILPRRGGNPASGVAVFPPQNLLNESTHLTDSVAEILPRERQAEKRQERRFPITRKELAAAG